MSESPEQRRRRKFAAGVLDQLAATIGGAGAGVFTAGTVAPIVAESVGTIAMSPDRLVSIVAGAFLLAASLVLGAVWLKGLAKARDDDAGRTLRPDRDELSL